MAHAKILKQLYGEDVKIVFAGPCICKKLEADYFNNLVDVVITFKDLKKWFEQSDINLKNIAPNQPEARFVPYRSGMGAYYPIEGGMLKGMQEGKKQIHHMAFSELSTVKDVLQELDTHREN